MIYEISQEIPIKIDLQYTIKLTNSPQICDLDSLRLGRSDHFLTESSLIRPDHFILESINHFLGRFAKEDAKRANQTEEREMRHSER